MATHPLKEWRSILVAVFILGIIAGANFWGNVSADSHGAGAAEARRTVQPPQNTADREVIQVEGGAVDVTAGVSIGENVPGASPGTPSQPVPNFSAINTPVWVSSQGPAQIVDDLVIYGLTEVKGGLINNGGVAPPGGGVPVPIPPSPDLSVTGPLTVFPASPQAGQTLTFSGTIQNIGNANAGISMARLTLVGVNPPVDVNTEVLSINGTSSISQFINWPATLGNHTFRICADVNSTITESNEGNNCSEQSFTVVAAPPVPPPQPDLAIDAPITIVPAVILAGNSVTFNATVRNRGSITANASSTRIRIDGNPIGGNLGNDAATGALNANATETERWIWTATQGNHTVQVCADIAAAVGESDEGNNCASQAFTVGAAPPALNIAIAPDTPFAGNVQQGSVDFTTTNFILTASGGDITVTSIAVTRTGIASDSNLSNLKLYNESNIQIGTTQNLNASTHKATFSGLNLLITVGDPQTLTVRTTVVSGQGNSFALSVSSGTDVVATSSGSPLTPTGSAPGNSFNIVAPAQTLTLTRVNVPVAGSALIAGSSVTLLEFDAQMNTGTVNLRQLFVVPKTVVSGSITNLRLVNATNDAILDAVADSATVRGQDAYSFGYGSASASNLLSIGTTITRLRVTGNVGCGNGAIEDHILEAAGDVIVREAGINIQTLPFATVSRTLTACPPPAAPTITTTRCNNGVYEATLAWTNTNGRGAAGYHIDVDQADVAANAFVNVAGPNDFLNTALIPANTLSATIPTATPLQYYDMTARTRGGVNQALLPNSNYFARIYYPTTNEHSLLLSFRPTFCAPPVPSRGGGDVRASILHVDGESSSGEPVTLFGAFIPQANAGWFAETANAQALPSPPATLHPVYVFDDLYVYGNGVAGPEPGNLFVRGGIVTEGNSNIGSVGSVTQFTGDVTVTGGTLSVGMLNVSGNLTVSNNVNITGNVTAASVGAFYRTESRSNRYIGNNVSASASCERGDILISCSGAAALPPASGNYRYYGAISNRTQCTASGGRLSIRDAIPITVNAQGVCFSPNGLPAGQTAVPTPP